MLQITKRFNIALLSVVLLVLAAMVFSGAKAFAAQVYKGPCDSDPGNYAISPPFTIGEESYDCVKNINDGDTVAGGASCDLGAFGSYSGYDTPFGKACLVPSKVKKSIVTKAKPFEADCKDENGNLNSSNCGIIRWIQLIINALSGVVGVTIVIMIIVGGIQYSAAGDDPQKVTAAKSKITNALLALFLFIFMFALLQWLVPGGIF